MTDNELNEHLARQVAKALAETGVEGGYGSISCSTKGDRPAIGVSQWEYGRADNLLQMIGGEALNFIGQAYSDIVDNCQLYNLSVILESEKGIEAQIELLAQDTLDYISELRPLFTNSKCLIYAATWCPTSLSSVYTVLKNRKNWGYDIDDLDVLLVIFRDEYANAVGCADYAYGYANRAVTMYNYLEDVDIWD